MIIKIVIITIIIIIPDNTLIKQAAFLTARNVHSPNTLRTLKEYGSGAVLSPRQMQPPSPDSDPCCNHKNPPNKALLSSILYFLSFSTFSYYSSLFSFFFLLLLLLLLLLLSTLPVPSIRFRELRELTRFVRTKQISSFAVWGEKDEEDVSNGEEQGWGGGG